MLTLKRRDALGTVLPLLAALLAVLAARPGEAAEIKIDIRDVSGDGHKDLIVDNGFMRLVFEPARGGNITSVIAQGQEFAQRAGNRSDGFMKALVRPYDWHSDFYQAPMTTKFLERAKDTCVIEFRQTGTNGDQKFLEQTKTYTIRANDASVAAELKLANEVRSQTTLSVGFWVHHHVIAPGMDLTFYQPPLQGTPAVAADSRDGRNAGVWNKQPSRGWSGLVDAGKRTGIAFTCDYTYLDRGLVWLAGQKHYGSVEHHLHRVPIPHGESWSTTITFQPFIGLDRIDGAGPGIVGALDTAVARATVRVVSSTSRMLTLKFMLVDPANGAKSLARLGSKTVSANAGEAATATVALARANEGVLVCDVYEGAARLARIERRIGKDNAKPYIMVALKKQFVPPRRDTYVPPLGRDLVTPHRVWAKPLAGGTLKGLFLLSTNHQRQVIEMVQRFDMDYLYVPLGDRAPFTFRHRYGLPLGRGMLSEKEGAALLAKTLKEPFPVMVIGDAYMRKYGKSWSEWSKLPGGIRQAILKKVERGCGLVYVNPTGLDDAAEKALTAKPVAGDHALLSWIPKGIILKRRREGVLTGQHGKGRIVIIKARCTGVQPYFDCAFDPKPAHLPDYYYALVARSMLWAAGREPAARFTGESKTGQSVRLSVSGPGETVAWELLDELGQVVAKDMARVTDGSLTITPPLPPTQGRTFLHAFLKSGKATHDWRVNTFDVTAPARIIAAEMAAMPRDGEPGVLSLEVSGEGLTARTAICAGTGDLYASGTHTLRNGDNRLTIEVPDLPTLGNRLRVELMAGKTVLDRCELHLNLPDLAKERRKRFFALVWGSWSGITDSFSAALGNRQLRRMGFDVNLSTFANLNCHRYRDAQAFNDADLGLMVQNIRHQGVRDHQILFKFQQTGDKKLLWREACLSSQEYQQQTEAAFKRALDQTRHLGVMLYHWGDECSYTYEGGHRGLDICFSPDTLRDFRVWLKQQYPTLAALNAEWGTRFKTWDAVEPMTSGEVKGRDKLGPWFDHRLFSDHLYCIKTMKRHRELVQKRDPTALMGEGGISAEMLAHGGFNWPLKLQAHSHLIPYRNTAIISQLAAHRPDFHYSARWIGYNAPPVDHHFRVWNCLFFGARSMSYWCMRHLLEADLSLSEPGRRTQKMLHELHSGIGDLLVSGTRRFDKIGVLYSQPSVLGAYALTGRGVDTYRIAQKNTTVWLEAFFDAGYQPILLTEDQIATSDVRALVLPMTLALSDASAHALNAFVSKGGLLIADVAPGIMSSHGRRRAKGRLDDLFGIKRAKASKLQARDVSLRVAMPDLGVAESQISGTVMETGLSVTTSKPMASMAGKWTRVGKLVFSRGGQAGGTRACFVRKVGRGKTLYLGILPSSLRDSAHRNILIDLMDHAGIKSDAEVRDTKGKRSQGIYVNRYGLGPITLVAVAEPPEHIRDASVERMDIPDLTKYTRDVVVRVPGATHYYDVRRKTMLGKGREARTKLIIGTGNLIAASPFPIGKVTLDNTRLSVKPGATVVITGRIDGCPQMKGIARITFRTGDEWRDCLLARVADIDGGRFKHTFPSPLDASGTWRVTVREAISGNEATATILFTR